MADIFISYKREDRAITERLVLALGQLGYDVWWDFEILSGDKFRRVVEQVIDKCGAVVVLWSKLSRESEFVLDEATYAKEQDKLCPVLIDDCRIPMGFGQTQATDLRDWKGEMDHHGFVTLVRGIEGKTGKKAKLGARARTEAAEQDLEELDAFKAAQIAGTSAALQTFLRKFPNAQFAAFVKAQLEGDGAAPAHAAPKPEPEDESEPEPEPELDDEPDLKSDDPPRDEQRRTMILGYELTQKRVKEVVITVAGLILMGGFIWAGYSILVKGEEVAKNEFLKQFGATYKPMDPTAVAGVSAPGPSSTSIYDSLTLKTPSPADDLTKQRPRVQEAVQKARSARATAETAAVAAREAAAQAKIAAKFAAQHLGIKGKTYGSAATPDGTTYQGELSNGTPNGYVVINAASQPGVSYAGMVKNASREGSGVATYATAPDEAAPSLYEGEWAYNEYYGFGVMTYANGDKFYGDFHTGHISVPMIAVYADGHVYEGQMTKLKPDGTGILWNANQEIVAAGEWRGGDPVGPSP